jgi:hypothetical protein
LIFIISTTLYTSNFYKNLKDALLKSQRTANMFSWVLHSENNESVKAVFPFSTISSFISFV